MDKKFKPLTRSFYDPNSYANAHEYTVTNIKLKLSVDFSRHVLSGYAFLTVEPKLSPSKLSGYLHLDGRDLKISDISDENNEKLKYEIVQETKLYGSDIRIELPKSANLDNKFYVKVTYETSPNAPAIQWFEPQQTMGGKHPYMFTQCQPILCRSLLPCQDTPSVKQTYDAEITTSENLRALMSAKYSNAGDLKDGLRTFRFVQDYPVPSYLIAIAIGNLKSGDLSYRSKVWCEPEMLEKAQYEFAEIDKLLQAAEHLLGPYLWGNYDILVLPPSFPYGGMENPCLTFLTPTVIAGDRSLVNVVAHEISHSWTGNLMTNKNWEHFWLNEGHTRYLEEKIISLVDGKKSADFLNYLGWQTLQDEVLRQGENGAFTSLVTNMQGKDPDEHYSIVPYEKGAAFLHYLEDLFGEKEFLQFLRELIKHYQFESFDSNDYKDYLTSYFTQQGKADLLKKIDWETWLYAPGLPPYKSNVDKSLHEDADKLSRRWMESNIIDGNFSSDDLKAFTPMQVIDFLDILIRKGFNDQSKLDAMKQLYQLSDAENCEFKYRWLALCIRAKYKPIVKPALEFLCKVGRLKYIKPLYTYLAEWPEMKPLAIKNFEEHRDQMHSVSAAIVAGVLGLQ